MSADNWAICPYCIRRDRTETICVVDPETRRTFREDYEQGMLEDGTFFTTYKGRCSACNFSHEFRHHELVLEPAPSSGHTEEK